MLGTAGRVVVVQCPVGRRQVGAPHLLLAPTQQHTGPPRSHLRSFGAQPRAVRREAGLSRCRFRLANHLPAFPRAVCVCVSMCVCSYYLNNFEDGHKQDALDLVTGSYTVTPGAFAVCLAAWLGGQGAGLGAGLQVWLAERREQG